METSIAYHSDLNDLQRDDAIAALTDERSARAPFDRLAWWRGLADACDLVPWIAVARRGSDMAILPLTRRPQRIESLANYYSFRWRPLMTQNMMAHNAQTEDGLTLMTALARDLAQHTGRLTLEPVPDEQGEASLLDTAFRAAGWVVERRICDSNHVLQLSGRTYADWLAGRPGSLRTTLARKAHRISVTIHDRFDPDVWAIYENIYEASWKGAEGSPEFLRRFALEEGAAGRLRLGLARAGDRWVAAQFWSVEAGSAFIHKLAYDEEAKALSPGSTLTATLLEHVIDHDHVALVDFGTGDEPYKRDWMDTVRPRYCLDMFRPDRVRHWPHIMRALSRKLGRKLGHKSIDSHYHQRYVTNNA